MAEEKKKEQQFRMDVDANEIALVKENEFEGTITATLTRGNRATTNQQVQLYLAGLPLGNPLETDENGKVVKDFTITTTAKSISVEAQTVGFATRAKKFITLPWPEKKAEKKLVPHKLDSWADGDEGNYRIYAIVLTEDGRPISDQLVIIDGKKVQTNPDGLAEHQITFQEERKKIIIKAGGQTDELTLSGPRKWREPPEIPAATEKNLQGSLWQVIRRAVIQARELKKQ